MTEQTRGTVYLFTPPATAPAKLREILLDWARSNGLDPARVIGSDGVQVDLDRRVIRYWEAIEPGDPGAVRPAGPGSVWKRRAEAPLLVDPPDGLARPPIGYVRALSVMLPSPGLPDRDWLLGELGRLTRDAAEQQPTAPAYDWEAYKRTCDPDRQLDGLGDLALFLGGSESSFTGDLLRLIAKAQATPVRFRALAAAFPREVTAWLAWREASRIPTAAELCAALVDNDRKRLPLHYLANAGVPHVLTNDDIWGPEAPTGPPPLPAPRNLAAELVDRGDGWHVSPELLAEDKRPAAGGAHE